MAPISTHVWKRGRETPTTRRQINKAETTTTTPPNKKVCKFWVSGRCVYGDRCRNLHPWYLDSNGDLSMVTRLSEHKEKVTGICLPTDSDKLITAYIDGTARVWDCNSGECVRVVNLKNNIGSIMSEGSWVFIGLPNVVQAWNGDRVYHLSGPVGQVHALESARDDTIFAGAQNGDILAWRGFSCPAGSNPFQLVGTLKGHRMTVTCLTVGKGRLYSGSMDCTIRVWNIDTLECRNRLRAHSATVTSLLCWDSYLFTSSLDKTINVWAATADDNLKVVHRHEEEEGIIALKGMHDNKMKPVICCSCKGNSVRVYELPSFMERCRLFAKKEIQLIQIGPDHHFFTGDATGTVTVWKWQENQSL